MPFVAQSSTPGSGIFEKGAKKHTVTLLLNGLAANGQIAVPAYLAVRRIFIFNRTANAVTGGINIGTAALGAQLLSAKAVIANDLNESLPVASLLTQAAKVFYVSAATAWNNAVLDVAIECELVTPITGNS